MRDRVEREVVTLDPADAPFLKGFPFKVHAMGARNHETKGTSPLARFGYTRRLVPWLRRHTPAFDVVIVNGLWNYAAVAGAWVLPSGATPYFVFPHGMLDPWFRKVNPVKHLVKQLSWLAFEGRLLKSARAVFFTSEEEARSASGQFFAYDYRAEVVSYGAADVGGSPAVQAQAFHAMCPTLNGRPYLLFLGRIHPKKGCDLLVRGFAAIAKVESRMQLVMAGPDQVDWAQVLRAEAASLGLSERVHWPGMLQDEAKWGAFRGAEAFVLPSHQENFGIAVAESLACSTPVLITDKVNIWREVEADGAGLIGSDDQAGVTSLLERWIGLSGEERSAMRLAARICFQKRFDVRAAAQDLVERVLRLQASDCPAAEQEVSPRQSKQDG